MRWFPAPAGRRIAAPTPGIRQAGREAGWQLRPERPALSPCPQRWPAPGSQYISAQAVHGFESDDVLIAKIGNGAANVRLTVGTLTEVTGDIRREAGVRRLGHQAQRGRDLVVGEHVQIRRLAQRHAERLLQRVIEDRIAGSVGEVADDECVLLSELGCTVAVIEVARHCENGDHQGSRDDNLP